MSEQKISCEGCGKVWIFDYVKNQVAARIVECPLCHIEKVE